MFNRLHKPIQTASAGLAMSFALLAALPSNADSSVAIGTAGALERAGQTQDALKNGTAASFGSPVTDDRRLFKLRWRLPWLLVGGPSLGPSPFVSGFTATSFAVPDGLTLAAEPMSDLSALVPTIAVGEPHKLGQLQLGALSTTLGHGTLLDRYTNSPDGLPRAAGLLLEGNLAGLGAQALVGDMFHPQTLAAARVYGRPLMWFLAPDATFQPNELDLDPRTEITGVWVLGVSGVVDAEAPSREGLTRVWAASVDNEAAILDNQMVKTIAWLDANALGVHSGAGGETGFGLHPGATFMVDVAGFRLDALAEMNFGTDGYVPRYFDRLYAIERVRSFGVDKAKVDVDRPGSWGYQLRTSVGFMESITGFVEVKDQMPWDTSRGGSNGQLTVGASGFVFFFGGAVTASQTGIRDFAHPDFLGPGFVVTAEGRVALVANVLHVVGRWWRAHVPAGDSADDYVVTEGNTVGLELNLDFL